MQATSSSISSNFSFPLCVSGVSRRLTLSKEMADHDRRRRGLRRERSSSAVVDRSFDSGPGTRFRRAVRGGTVAAEEIRGDAGAGTVVVVADKNGTSVSGTCPSHAGCWPCVAKAA